MLKQELCAEIERSTAALAANADKFREFRSRVFLQHDANTIGRRSMGMPARSPEEAELWTLEDSREGLLTTSLASPHFCPSRKSSSKSRGR